MANMFEDLAGFMADNFEDHFSESDAIYTALAGGTVTLDASIGKNPYETEEETTFIEDEIRMDFIVKAASLLINGSEHTPARGDTIKRTNGEIYTVATGQGGDMAYRYCDAFGKGIRIHTFLSTGV